MSADLKTRLAVAVLACLVSCPAVQAVVPTTFPATGGVPFANDPQYLEVTTQFSNGHYRQAIPRLVELVGRYPQHARLQLLLADAYERSNQLSAARDLNRAALASKPDPKAEAVATEAVARLTRLIEQSAGPSTTAPATGGNPFELTDDQKAAMIVVGPEQTRRKTEHFDIATSNPALADALAQRVEAVLERARQAVLGEQVFPHRIELIVYPDQASFQKAQPVAHWSGGGYLFAPQPDGTVRRAVLLYQVDEEHRFRSSLLTRELPHELAHVVLKEYFGQATGQSDHLAGPLAQPACPAWLDEGLACMAEADGGKALADKMADMLSRQLATPLAEMIDRIKPAMDRPVAFYVQAVSWTRFLRSSLTDAQMHSFLAQIKDGQKPSIALGRVLVLDDQPGWLGAMEERWHKWVTDQK